MSSFSCEACGDVFTTESEHKAHFTSGVHSRNLQRHRSKNQQVFVANYPPAVRKIDLRNYFSNYGEVRNVYLDKKKNAFAFVEFASESNVQYALNFTHFFWGRRLVVRNYVNFGTRANRPGSAIQSADIVPQLVQCPNVGEQVQLFSQKVCLSQEDVDTRKSLCTEIEEILRKYYPSCNVHIFGSTTNGFGSRGCDVDLLFEPSPTYWQDHIGTDTKPRNKKKGQSFSPSDVEKGVVPYEEFLNQRSHSHIQFIHKVLQNHPTLFQRPIYIPARCPIVKFMHKTSSLCCDLSCSSRLVLINTDLLKFYAQLDARVVPVLLVLRHWAKLQGIVRVGGLSSYAFSLMVLFFLQNRKPSVVPSVTHLKSLADKELIESGWDCSFCNDPSKIPPSTNTESVENLILEFFNYYADFDFSFVISPLTGEKMERGSFDVPDEDEEHCFKSRPICIQDPLECHRNVSAFVKVRVLMLLKDMVKYSASFFKSKMASPPSDPSWGILSLLKEAKVHQQVMCIVPSDTAIPPPKNGLVFTVMFGEDWKDCLANYESNDCLWLSKITSLLVDVFEHALGFETEVVDKFDRFSLGQRKRKRSADGDDEAPPAKVSRVDTGIDFSEDDVPHQPTEPEPADEPGLPESSPPQLLVSVQNIVEHNVWSRRRKCKDDNPDVQIQYGRGQYLELEHAITSLILKDSTKLAKPVYFTCDCYTYRHHSCDRLVFCLTPFLSSPDFRSMAFFLKSFLPPLLGDSMQ